MARLVLFVALLFAALSPAQSDLQSVVRNAAHTVFAHNGTGYPRWDMVTTVVSFRQGVYAGDVILVGDALAQTTRIGPTWPDGSWRTARITFPLQLQANSSVSAQVTTAPDALVPDFEFSPTVAVAIPFMTWGMRFGGRVVTFSDWHYLESGPYVRALRSRLRDGDVWAELMIEYRSGLDSIRWWLHYGTSNQNNTDVRHQVQDLAFVVRQGVPACWPIDRAQDIRQNETKLWVMLLHDAEQWGDGESQAWKGAVVFERSSEIDHMRAEVAGPVLACSLNWSASGAFGPWGFVGDAPPGWSHEQAQEEAEEYAQAVPPASPWVAPTFGCGAVPSATGDQRDFSATVLHQVALGYPYILWPVGMSVRQESCRPTWVRNADGSPFRFSQHIDRARTQLHLWDGQLFHTSPERLGKGNNNPGTVHGFKGHDRQHWSINYLTTWALLTGDRWGLQACRHHAELWLGSNQTRSGNAVIDKMEVSRGEGRTIQAAVKLWLVTGDNRLLAGAEHRVRVIDAQWAGKDTSPTRPMWVGQPDARRLGGRYPYWCPWFDFIGVRGLDAYVQQTGDPVAREIAYQVGKSAVRWGCWQEGGRWIVGYSVAWQEGGAALTQEQIDSGQYREAGGGDWLLWSIAGIRATRREAVARGEQDVIDRCDLLIAEFQSRPADWRRIGWDGLR